MKKLIMLLLVALAALGAAAAAQTATSRSEATTLTIYSGREERLVKPLFEQFTKQTGIELQVRYGSSSEMAATILEEGRNSRADVFFSQEAGLLGFVAREGLLKVLPASTLARVPARFRAPGKRWVGTSGRARVIAYNTSELTRAQVPKTIWELTKPQWKGKIGLPPTNASFQAFVAVMRITSGEDRTRDWLLGLKANDVRFYGNNTQVVQAVGRGEVQLGLVNHYYLHNIRVQTPTIPVENAFLGKGDPGALVNCAGVGIVSSTKNSAAAQRFVDFLLSPFAQRFIARGPGAAEYPLVRGVRPRPGLPPLGEIKGPEINLGRLGRDLPPAIRLLNEVGYTR
ncbi:MAG: iron ABC transporter substrate-binding protein [Gaiellaceae bacterium MAG52_C11]|nr:iron ABC transporter substrate-binding protein [Candidatus Gaiellasilicea maunaloa]